MPGRPVDLTTPVRPIPVPESPDSGPGTAMQLPGTNTAQMADIPQIQVMSPRSNLNLNPDPHNGELGYDAIVAQQSLVQRAQNQRYTAFTAENTPVPDEMTIHEVHVREAVFSNTSVSAQGHVREAVFSNTHKQIHEKNKHQKPQTPNTITKADTYA